MTYAVPVQFNSRPHRGYCKSRVETITVTAQSRLEAFRIARDHAASWLGSHMEDPLAKKVFRAATVELRSDLFVGPK